MANKIDILQTTTCRYNTLVTVETVLNDHRVWVRTEGRQGIKASFRYASLYGAKLAGEDFKEVDFIGADLYEIDLSGANLERANLDRTNLARANLARADLTKAKLTRAKLVSTNLKGADLTAANLFESDLTRADLSGAKLNSINLAQTGLDSANLSGTDLSTANLTNAQIKNADLTNTKLPNYQIPQTGSLIGYKKVFHTYEVNNNYRGKYILKLEILAESKRTGSLISNKCRAEYAKVIGWRHQNEKEFHTEPGEFCSFFARSFIYRMGETVKPINNYDPDPCLDCTSGIHFFMNEVDAQNYFY